VCLPVVTTATSDNTRQLVLDRDEELDDSQTNNNNVPSLSDHQADMVQDTIDMSSSKDNSSEVEKDSSTSENVEIAESEMVTESAVDEDTETREPETELDLHVDSPEDQRELTAESVVDKNMEDVERDETQQDTLMTNETDGVEEGLADVDDDEQFLSPAASEADIIGNLSPTNELPDTGLENGDMHGAGSMPWSSAQVPLLDVEPPAMDSDYEEASLCDTEEPGERNSEELKEKGGDMSKQDVDDVDASSPAASNTSVKPKLV